MDGNVVLELNENFLNHIRKAGGAPGPIARIGAMMHLAIFDAINLTTGSQYKPYTPGLPMPDPSATPEDSAKVAACEILKYAYPKYINSARNNLTNFVARSKKVLTDSQISFLSKDSYQVDPDLDINSFIAGICDGLPTSGPSKDFGNAVAQKLIELRDADEDGSANADETPSHWPPYGFYKGDWENTDLENRFEVPPVTPLWGKVKLFSEGKNVQDFLPDTISKDVKDPLELLSDKEYIKQFMEVADYGGADSKKRDEEMTQIAFFWANDVDRTSKPPGQLFTITQLVARQENTVDDILETARLFALVAIAMADAAAVAWHMKYLFPKEGNKTDHKNWVRLWRPDKAIRNGWTDGNPDTKPQSDWEPLSINKDGKRFSPPFPAYISGHATFGAAHAAVMTGFYGKDDIEFTATSEDPNAKGGPRKFKSFSAAAIENGESRIYLGVHYRWDAQGGYQSGTAVGNHVFLNLLHHKQQQTVKESEIEV